VEEALHLLAGRVDATFLEFADSRPELTGGCEATDRFRRSPWPP
jgi:hypothetical protein